MVINSAELEKQKRKRKKRRRGWWLFPFHILGAMKTSGVASTATAHRLASRADKGCHMYNHIRCIVWFFLLLYLLTCGPDLLWLLASSSFSGGEVAAVGPYVARQSLHNTVSLPTLFSRAVVEASNDTVMHQPTELLSASGLMEDLKVFVYELPSRFNSGWLSNKRCSSHLFAAEVAIHQALLKSSYRTLKPEEAHFFFVPIYATCNFSTVNGFPAIGHARPLFAAAVSHIASSYPFWNRSNGADHVFVATHDHGACFHTMEDVARKDGIPEFLKRSIIVQTFGVKGEHPCQDAAALTVQIPPYVPPAAIGKALVERKRKRDIWVFFRGKMEIHPKNISGRVYSRGLRTEIWRRYSGRKRFYVKRERAKDYLSEIARSVFCLCPLGWAPWSPRIVESVALGCVPVIIADDIRMPFRDSVPWPEISLTVAERDVGLLGHILSHVAATNLSVIQRNLWVDSNRRSLLFNVPLRLGDATWQILRALSRHRRSTPVASFREFSASSPPNTSDR
ncbi:unnamed protein product [Victoria cruziana]